MKRIKAFCKEYPSRIVFFVIAVICASVTAVISDYRFAIAEGILIIFSFITAIYMFSRKSKRLDNTVRSAAGALDFSQKDSLYGFPLALSVCDVQGKIMWYNDLFRARIIGDTEIENTDISQFTSGMEISEIRSMDSVSVENGGNCYTVYSSQIISDTEPMYVLYFVDDTYLKKSAQEYKLSKPAVILASIDNMDDVYQTFSEQEASMIVSGINTIVDNWMSQSSCLVKKLSNSRFIAVAEERDLQDMIAKKFDILDKIRSFKLEDRNVGVTLSIGVGRGDNFRERSDVAKESLDMAQGRGGDQAAIKNKGNFEFFGGISKSVEKRTKVKSRIIASAISELLDGSDNVLIMGHRYSDLDSLGSAIGLYSASKAMGIKTHIVMSKDKSLAKSLIVYMEENGMDDAIIDSQTALKLLTKKSLLFILDTHRADFTESKDLYEQAPSVVVIDHHRKTVDHIANAVIFYHEPSSSSTSEMITELLQYMPAGHVGKLEAEALLAGIMLDTKNFVLQTGVRTFEAAAYLRSKGADTVTVKRLFATSMDNIRLRNEIIDKSVTYRNCAISVADVETSEIRILSSQAADDMLNIDNVKSSFVLFKTGNTINISARSMGEMNVQIIMENLGGGGHLTMAAAQLEDISLKDANQKLIQAIDVFYSEQKA